MPNAVPDRSAPRGRGRQALPALAVALLALAAIPAAAASPAPSTAAAPAATASSGVWAWGAFENATYTSAYVGAYADWLNLTGGNFSSTGAYVAVLEQLHAEYGAFAVINASAPTTSTRSVEAAAVSIANDSGIVAVTGALPLAGTYAPGATVPLGNQTSYYVASIVAITAYLAFANYTVTNGTLDLVDEHVAAVMALNTTTIAWNWPTVTIDPNGSTTVAYTTAAFTELGYVAEDVAIAFTPSLPIAETPLSVGETWNATTTAAVTGWAGYAVAAAYATPTSNATSASSGAVSLNATASLTFDFAVVGSESVVDPNGTTETGYAVAVSENGATPGDYVLWDGLAVLPGAGPVPAAALKPATPVDAAAPISDVAGPAGTAVVGASGFPLATSSTGSGGSGLVSAPVTPSTAQSTITSTGTPARPTTPTTSAPRSAPVSTAPVSTGPTSAPPSSGTPTSGTPSSPTSGATATPNAHAAGLDPFVLVGLVAGMVAIFLAVELGRERRRR